MATRDPGAVELSPEIRRKLERNIPRFLAFRALISFQLLFGIWVIYLQEDRGLSLGQVTGMEGPFWLAMVLLEVPTGVVADRYGRKTSLLLGGGIYTTAVVVFAIAGNYPLLFASYIAFALAMTLFSGADGALVYDSLKPLGREHEYQRIWGLAWAVQSGGAAIAIFLAGPIASQIGLRAPILIDAGIAVAGTALALTLFEPPRHDEGGVRLTVVAATRRAASIAWHTRTLRLAFAFGSFVTAGAFATEVLVQPYLRSHDVSLAWFGPLLLVHSLAATAGALWAGRVQGRLGWRSLLLLLLVIVLGPLALLTLVDSLWMFAAYLALGAAGGLQEPIFSDFVNRRVPSSLRATSLSLRSLCYSLVLAAMLPVMGAVGEREGLPVAFGLGALFVAAIALPLLPMLLRAIAAEEPPEGGRWEGPRDERGDVVGPVLEPAEGS